MSDNGTRIAARWLAEWNGVERVRLAVGPRAIEARMFEDGLVETDLGEGRGLRARAGGGPGGDPGLGGKSDAVVVGDPDVLSLIGPLLETQPRFAERTNVQVARLDAPGHVTARVRELGVGETTASGTSTVAVAAALRQNPAKVRFPRGIVEVRLEGRPASIIGPAVRVG